MDFLDEWTYYRNGAPLSLEEAHAITDPEEWIRLSVFVFPVEGVIPEADQIRFAKRQEARHPIRPEWYQNPNPAELSAILAEPLEPPPADPEEPPPWEGIAPAKPRRTAPTAKPRTAPEPVKAPALRTPEEIAAAREELAKMEADRAERLAAWGGKFLEEIPLQEGMGWEKSGRPCPWGRKTSEEELKRLREALERAGKEPPQDASEGP